MIGAVQTILHGKLFIVCDDHGDVRGGTHGIFARDTRHVSHLELLIDGERPQELGAPHGPDHRRTFVQRNLASGRVPSDALLVRREYLVADAFHLRFAFENLRANELSPEVRLRLRADFDDVFVVKQQEFTRLGDNTGEVGLGQGHPQHERLPIEESGCAVLRADDGTETWVVATEDLRVDEDALVWEPKIPGRGSWTLDVRLDWSHGRARIEHGVHDAERERVDGQLEAWLATMPELGSAAPGLIETWAVSMRDLAALRMRSDDAPDAMLPAAGMPWYMTVFGRDTAITCMQTMLLGPGRAEPALDNLAALQAVVDDPQTDAEPGKILHEVREGGIASRGYSVYYGSIDSTPLYLILLGEVYRWTADEAFVRRHRDTALRALEWLRHHGDLDGDGYLEYRRRSPQGIDNHSWKDSWDSQRFHDGSRAMGPIAPVEVQGYAYDARLRIADLAEVVWGDDELAHELRIEAALLRERFERDFWVPPEDVPNLAGTNDPRREGFYALALDGRKRRLDSLTSNVGHLLWSGIVGEERARITARQLVSREMANGFGVRTMSTGDAAYNPLAYHNGTVWPHDTSICAAGLARYGFIAEAGMLAHGMLRAAEVFGGRLPEVFAGLDEADTEGRPVLYPTTCSPQAWAAAAPVLALTELLGIVPDTAGRALRVREQVVPSWLDGLSIRNIRAFGERWRIQVRRGTAFVERG